LKNELKTRRNDTFINLQTQIDNHSEQIQFAKIENVVVESFTEGNFEANSAVISESLRDYLRVFAINSVEMFDLFTAQNTDKSKVLS
jgi:hypothetical protein